MKFLRRFLGIFVMVAGVIGLVLSLSGLVSVWMFKPTFIASVDATLNTLTASIDTSQRVVETTQQALGATVASVDALSSMLSTTAQTVEDTKPMLDQITTVLGEKLPATFEDAATSLKTSQQAAAAMESTMKSVDSFRTVLSAVPPMNLFVKAPEQPYNPDIALANSLGQLAANLQDMPATFTDMSNSLSKADSNMGAIQENLTTMSGNVALISKSLGDYQAMLKQSQSSMDNLKTMLINTEQNLATTANWALIVLTLFFLWLLATQVVIFSQGWELFQGTAGRMEGKPSEPAAIEPATAA